MRTSPQIQTKELKPSLWPDLKKLFGSNGACGGCWCMSWRREKGDDWEKLKGAGAQAKFKKLVTTGKAHGILAYVNGEPMAGAHLIKEETTQDLIARPVSNVTMLVLYGQYLAFSLKKTFVPKVLLQPFLNMRSKF